MRGRSDEYIRSVMPAEKLTGYTAAIKRGAICLLQFKPAVCMHCLEIVSFAELTIKEDGQKTVVQGPCPKCGRELALTQRPLSCPRCGRPVKESEAGLWD
jgi:peptide subunit release factor 1 (eRF1)